MNFDLFAPDITDEHIAAFCKRGVGCLIIGTALGDLAIVPFETVSMFPGKTCYTPQEIRFLVTLPMEKAQKFHKMKKSFGGYMKETGL